MSKRSLSEQALEQGKGIVRLAPNWVPRHLCVPGKRMKLHPDDHYALELSFMGHARAQDMGLGLPC